MKILIFSTAYLPFVGGAELAIKEITDRLSPQELAFDLITLNLDRRERREEMVGNVRVVRLSCPKWWFPLLAFITAARLHRAKPYTSIWSVMASYGGFAGLFFKYRFPRIPFILTLQEGDSFAHIYRRVFFVWPLFKMIFTRADRITAISKYLADWARRIGARCPIEVIPNGVNVKRFMIYDLRFKNEKKEQIRKKLGVRLGDKVVITTSRLVKKNGVGDLIEAMRYLPEEVKLLICGIGPLESGLRLTANRYTLNARVKFVGHIPHEELPAYLHASDIFCRPSLSEGMGSSFVEAMAAGLPVVATPVGGIPDFLSAPLPGSEEEKYLFSNSRELDNRWEEKMTGLFVSVRNPKDIAAKINLLLSNDALREHIVENASRMVREKYDWDGIAKKIKAIFSESLAMNWSKKDAVIKTPSFTGKIYSLLTGNRPTVIVILLVGLVSSVMGIYSFFSPPAINNNDSRALYILYHGGEQPKIEIANPTQNDFYLWGDQFGHGKKTVEQQARILPAGRSYFLNADLLSRWIEINIPLNESQLVSFNVFFKNGRQKKYVMKNNLLIRRTQAGFNIQPQTLSFDKEEW